MIKMLLKKTILFALVAALGVASLPFVGVSAMGANDPTPPPRREVSNERLENIWARQLRAYERMGKADDFVERIQKLIDRAESNGKDVATVQAALTALEAAVEGAQPLYASVGEIVNSHEGFDASGKVTDTEKAKETVKAMGEKLKEIRESMNGTGKALRDAIQAFREANPRPERTPTP